MFDGIDHLGLFVAAGLLLNLTPGPDVLYIVSQGLRGGWRGGCVAALGITAGCFVHIAAATVGLSALVASSATAFTVLKWVGAAYLVYVGVGMLRARAPDLPAGAASSTPVAPEPLPGAALRPQETHAAPDLPARAGDRVAAAIDLRRVFAQGFWTNALNPKVALFFLAFLPQFIAGDAAHTGATFLLLGLIFNLNALPVNLAYGLGAAWLAGRLRGLRRGMLWLERGAGALFVYFGVRLASAGPAASA